MDRESVTWRAAAFLVGLALVLIQWGVASRWERDVSCPRDAAPLVHATQLSRMDAASASTLLLRRFYPPGYELTLAGIFRIAGIRSGAFLPLNALHLALLILAAYGIGSRLASREAGFWAAVLVGLSPFVMIAIRRPTRDFGLVGLVALTIWLLVRGSRRLRAADGAWLGLAAGAAMMTKWTAAAFLLVPTVLEFSRSVGARGDRRRAARFWSIAGATALAVCGPWYLASDVFREIGEQARVDPMVASYGAVLFPQVARYYAGGVLLAAVGIAFAVLVLGRQSRRAACLLAGWGMVPVLLFEGLPHRELRHVLAGMAAFVIAIPVALDRFPRRWSMRIAMLLLAVFLATSLFENGVRRFFIVHETGFALERSASCSRYYEPTCAAVEREAARLRAEKQRAPRRAPVTVAFAPGSEPALCVYPETMQFCRLARAGDSPPRWRLVYGECARGDAPPNPGDVDLWLEVRNRSEPPIPPSDDFVLAERIDADCEPEGHALDVRLWRHAELAELPF